MGAMGDEQDRPPAYEMTSKLLAEWGEPASASRHDCDPPDADAAPVNMHEWKCPDCGKVHERHWHSWWEPRDD